MLSVEGMESATSRSGGGGSDIRIVSTHGNVAGGSLEVDMSAEVDPPAVQVRNWGYTSN